MRIEVYYSPYCRGCGGLHLPAGTDAAVAWKDVTRHLEEAVRLGVSRPPALVVDGQLVAQGPEAMRRLDTLLARPKVTSDA